MNLQYYKNHITTAFVNNTRRGYADWRDCGRLCTDVIDSLEESAKELCAEDRYDELFRLCNWTYIKWNNTDKDDSNGETQEFCACVYDIWQLIYCDGKQSFSHDRMLDGLLAMLSGSVYDYMEDNVYSFILEHFKTEAELEKKEQFLIKDMEEIKRKIPERDVLKYSLYVKEDYYVRIIADQRRPIQEIRDFLNTRDSYTNKELLAQIENEYGNYDEAITLYREQIDARPDSYWSDAPRKALMEIYKRMGDTDAYNEELYKMMLCHTDDSKYYLEYKALFTEQEWQMKWKEILETFKDRLQMINTWLSIEGRYDIIMDNAEPDHEYIINTYEKVLFSLYPERCFKVLTNAADRSIHTSSKRRDYRYVARLLSKIAAHPGGREISAGLAAKYRAQYPRRTAMIDELRRF